MSPHRKLLAIAALVPLALGLVGTGLDANGAVRTGGYGAPSKCVCALLEGRCDRLIVHPGKQYLWWVKPTPSSPVVLGDEQGDHQHDASGNEQNGNASYPRVPTLVLNRRSGCRRAVGGDERGRCAISQ